MLTITDLSRNEELLGASMGKIVGGKEQLIGHLNVSSTSGSGSGSGSGGESPGTGYLAGLTTGLIITLGVIGGVLLD